MKIADLTTTNPLTSPGDAQQASEANIVRSVGTDVHIRRAASMDSEQLADYVTHGWGTALLNLVELKPYVEALWQHFDSLPKGEAIAGCKTRKEFCYKLLHRSPRAIQYMLYGRAPAKIRPREDSQSTEHEGESVAGNTLDERDELEAPQVMLRRHACEILKVLTAPSVIDDSSRIRRAASLVHDLQRALDDGVFNPTPGSQQMVITPRPILSLPAPPNAVIDFQQLRRQIAELHSTEKISRAVEAYLATAFTDFRDLGLTFRFEVTVAREHRDNSIILPPTLPHRVGPKKSKEGTDAA
jgi:hypothetical protein